MARRSVNFYLIKVVRISGWFLFVLVLLYIISGYALCYEFGFDKLLGPEKAAWIHNELHLPLVVVFLAHTLPSIYLALRRWGWIGRKRRV